MISAYRNPDLIRKIKFGGRVSPGTCTIKAANRNPNWQHDQPQGTTGASSKLKGSMPGECEIEFFLSDIPNPQTGLSDQDEWDDFQALIESTTSGPKPFALPIEHPDLALQGFTEMCNGGVSAPLRDDRGGVTVTVKLTEYWPAKPKPAAKATAKAGKGAAGSADAYDPNARAKRELAELTDQASRP